MAISMPNMHKVNTFISLHDKPFHRFDYYRQLPSGGEAEDRTWKQSQWKFFIIVGLYLKKRKNVCLT
jgi:hypothetical protein